MVRSSQVSPLDIQIKKGPADIFIPHLPNPTHYPYFIICILFAFFAPKVSRGFWRRPWNPTAAGFYVSCFTEDPGDLSLLYVTVPFYGLHWSSRCTTVIASSTLSPRHFFHLRPSVTQDQDQEASDLHLQLLLTCSGAMLGGKKRITQEKGTEWKIWKRGNMAVCGIHLFKSPEKRFGKGRALPKNLEVDWTNQIFFYCQLATFWRFLMMQRMQIRHSWPPQLIPLNQL